MNTSPISRMFLSLLAFALILPGPGALVAIAGDDDTAPPQRTAKEAIDGALDWLARAQSPDGRWDSDQLGGHSLYDMGVTGLALLAFLGAGETHEVGPHRDAVKRALHWIQTQQDPEGCFGTRAYDNFVYGHAIATLAMSEAYGLTGSPLFKRPAQKGVDFIQKIKNPHKAWRYGIRPGDNDTSVTGWMVMALKSAQASGLQVDLLALADARKFIESVTNEVGRVGYTQPGLGPVRPVGKEQTHPSQFSESLTAIGILTRIYTGENPAESDAIRKGTALCTGNLPHWVEPKLDFYYWYYGTLAMWQVGSLTQFEMGHKNWEWWHEALRNAILGKQVDSGEHRGSWDPVDAWGDDGGRVYATALLTMCLEVSYRYAKILTPQKPAKKRGI